MEVPTEAASDEDELDAQWIMTEEMMEDDHLYPEVKDGLTIDAYVTPFSYYRNGIGVWEPSRASYEDTGDEDRTCENLSEDESVLGVTTIGTVTDALDRMAQTLGEVYELQWEQAKKRWLLPERHKRQLCEKLQLHVFAAGCLRLIPMTSRLRTSS